MRHLKEQKHLDFIANFPWHQYPNILPNQKDALEVIAGLNESVILELPTGSGKTAIGYTFLKTLEKAGRRPLFYITPTKTLVEQVQQMHPEVMTAYGRNEFPCLYYPKQQLKADEIPCSLLIDCPHQVDQKTGETKGTDTAPCPYLLQKYRAKQSQIVVCTTAFYLFTQLFSKEWEEPGGLVIDEAHRIARTVRNLLSYEITDYHLQRAISILQVIGAEEAEILDDFLKDMIRIIRLKPAKTPALLEYHEIEKLMSELVKIDSQALQDKIGLAIEEGRIDPVEQREVLKGLEVVSRDLNHYLSSLGYSLPSGKREALSYTFAFYEKGLGKAERANYRLFIKAYYVAPLIKRLLSPFTVTYSATIGNNEIFGFETGIKAPFYTFSSDFPAKNTRIFLPTDTPNLALKSRSRREPTMVLRKIAKACRRFSLKGLRSLIVVISEKERQKFLKLCKEEGVKAISYGDGIPAKDAATKFKNGEGNVLVGTAANYGEGIDLPKTLAPIIFFLRPGYPNPTSPETIFEERRFRNMRWKLWNWRTMIELLQVRGRNIRNTKDLGVAFLISQQFRRFVMPTLPEWLIDAYEGSLTFEQCLEKAEKMLS